MHSGLLRSLNPSAPLTFFMLPPPVGGTGTPLFKILGPPLLLATLSREEACIGRRLGSTIH